MPHTKHMREFDSSSMVSSPWLAGLALAWGSLVLFSVIVNLAPLQVMARVFFPTSMSLVLTFWVAPTMPGLLIDQAALHGILGRICEMAVPLLSIRPLPEDE